MASSGNTDNLSHWKEVSSFTCGQDENIHAQKFVSDKTKLSVVLADIQGPLVNGYFSLATEAHDDDGLPHTLEHLIFLGSEDYPYKGILDLISNRCLSSGTNAWTDTDHTCYTMTGVGSEGFLNMFPVYVDHILFPTLTESGYITEVHHVNGDGEDAGVVYCEMQGRENSGESRVYLEMIRAENLCLIITGVINPYDVFRSLEPIEEKILKQEPTPFVRPWQDEIPPFPTDVEISVPYPCDEEDNGMVYIGLRGPRGDKELHNIFATQAMLEYLTESAVSPLNAAFVEIDDPFASGVDYHLIEQTECGIVFRFDNVPYAKIGSIKSHFEKVLKSLEQETFDIKRMEVILERKISRFNAYLESSPHDMIAFEIIGDALYGQQKEDMNSRLNPDKFYKKLLLENSNFWIKLLKEIAEKPKVFAKGIPSINLQKEMARDEATRISTQRELLGDEGLKQKGNIVMKAMEENEKEAPEELFEKLKIPGIDSISFHSIKTVKTGEQTDSFLKLDNFKFPGIFSNVESNFVSINTLLDTRPVPKRLKSYLPLLCQVLLESPMEDGDASLTYEEVVKQLDADTVSRFFSLGMSGRQYGCGQFGELLILHLKVEKKKYEKGVFWIQKLLSKTIFSPERIKIIATKAENGIAELKRHGGTVAKAIHKLLCYSEDSNQYWNLILTQQNFLKSLLKQLGDTDNVKEVIEDFEHLRKLLLENISVHLAANFDKLQGALDPWTHLTLKNHQNLVALPKFEPDNVKMKWDEKKLRNLIVGLGSVESSFLIRSANGISDFQHTDLAPLMLYFQYLAQLEGPMWRKIRGAGLSYGYGLGVDVNQGLIVLSLTKSTHPGKALNAALDIIRNSVRPEFEWNQIEFESAKSSLIFELVEGLQSVSGSVSNALGTFLKGLDENHTRIFLDKVLKVTLDDLKRVGDIYVKRILDTNQTNNVLVCHPSKIELIKSELKT